MTASSALVALQSAEWAQGLFTEQEIYWATAAFMAAVTLVFLVAALRMDGRRRRYGLVVVYTSVVLTLAYVGMANGVLRYRSLDGAAVPVTRFVGYAFGTTTILLMTGHVGGFSRRLQAAILVPFLGISLGTLGGWFFEPPLNRIASLSSLLSLPLIAYLLLGPGARSAAETTSDRRLLFGKLRNIVLLAWLGYLVVGILSRQNLALLDGFVGVFIGTYIDVALYVGFGFLLLRTGNALDQLARGEESRTGGADDDGGGVQSDGEPAAAAD